MQSWHLEVQWPMFVSDRVGAVSDTAGRAENNEVVQILRAAASSSDWGCHVSKEISSQQKHTYHTQSAYSFIQQSREYIMSTTSMDVGALKHN